MFLSIAENEQEKYEQRTLAALHNVTMDFEFSEIPCARAVEGCLKFNTFQGQMLIKWLKRHGYINSNKAGFLLAKQLATRGFIVSIDKNEPRAHFRDSTHVYAIVDENERPGAPHNLAGNLSRVDFMKKAKRIERDHWMDLSWRQSMYLFLEEPSSMAARFVSFFLLFCVIVSCLSYAMLSIPKANQTYRWLPFDYIELVTVVFFTGDYLIRLINAPCMSSLYWMKPSDLVSRDRKEMKLRDKFLLHEARKRKGFEDVVDELSLLDESHIDDRFKELSSITRSKRSVNKIDDQEALGSLGLATEGITRLSRAKFEKAQTLDRGLGRIRISVWYNMKQKKLWVRLFGAENLLPLTVNKLVNPYAKMYLLPDSKQQHIKVARVINRTLNPSWDIDFSFDITYNELQSMQRTLGVSVWGHHWFSEDEFLGQVLVEMKDTPRILNSTVPRAKFWGCCTRMEGNGASDLEIMKMSRFHGLQPKDTSQLKKKLFQTRRRFNLVILTSANKVWRFIIKPLNIVDLISVLPFYLEVIMMEAGILYSGAYFGFFKILRLTRMFRVFKLGKYSALLMRFARVMWKASDAFSMMFFLVVIGMVVFGTMLYYAEGGTLVEDEYLRNRGVHMGPQDVGQESSPFLSIPSTFWFIIVTITQVGYGDQVPTTLGGYAVTVLIMHAGMFLLAMPITIIGSILTYDIDHHARKSQKERQHEEQRFKRFLCQTVRNERLRQLSSRVTKRKFRKNVRRVMMSTTTDEQKQQKIMERERKEELEEQELMESEHNRRAQLRMLNGGLEEESSASQETTNELILSGNVGDGSDKLRTQQRRGSLTDAGVFPQTIVVTKEDDDKELLELIGKMKYTSQELIYACEQVQKYASLLPNM